MFALVAFTFAEDEDSPAHWYDKQEDDMLHLLSTFFHHYQQENLGP